MKLTRREMLAASLAAMPTVGALASSPKPVAWPQLGVVIHSYGIRIGADRRKGVRPGFSDPLVFLEHCHELGAAGIQVGIGARDRAYVRELRRKCDAYRMYLEGTVQLPRDRKDLDRFTAEVRTARDAGATVLRTVLLNGRRYETFNTAAAFITWHDQAYHSLTLAEPVAGRHRVELAVENHKDLRSDELIALLKRLASPRVGFCVDTGNSIALLEDPLAVVEALAPWARTTHFKDMAVAEFADGFLLSEVPLTQGFLDLTAIVAVLRRARPGIHFNLEMITRDPLRVPCLTPRYWATFQSLPGRYLAQTLALVRKHKSSRPLPHVSTLPEAQRMEVEENNVRVSLRRPR
ncbi:MAG TPA: TIM barrel protein [Gemmataceae bacterium]|nr:TIM barrel protein [Gemmataceae bacterium]